MYHLTSLPFGFQLLLRFMNMLRVLWPFVSFNQFRFCRTNLIIFWVIKKYMENAIYVKKFMWVWGYVRSAEVLFKESKHRNLQRPGNFKNFLHVFEREVARVQQDSFLILEIELPGYCQCYGKLFSIFYSKICRQTCHKTFWFFGTRIFCFYFFFAPTKTEFVSWIILSFIK